MCLVGGIHFSGASGNSCAGQQRVRELEPEASPAASGLISKAWPRPSCQSASPASLAKYSLSSWLTVTVCAASTASAVVR